MTEPLPTDEFAKISREFYLSMEDFRRAVADRSTPIVRVRTWKWSILDDDIWCAEDDCGCEAENSRIMEDGFDFRERSTLTDLRQAIAEHIAQKHERDAEERAE